MRGADYISSPFDTSFTQLLLVLSFLRLLLYTQQKSAHFLCVCVCVCCIRGTSLGLGTLVLALALATASNASISSPTSLPTGTAYWRV